MCSASSPTISFFRKPPYKCSLKVLVGAHALIFENSAAGFALMMSLAATHGLARPSFDRTSKSSLRINARISWIRHDQARALVPVGVEFVLGQHFWPRDGRVQCVSLPQAFAKYGPCHRRLLARKGKLSMSID